MGLKHSLKLFLKPVADKAYKNLIDKERAKKIINSVATRSQVDLLDLAHKNMGIMKYGDTIVSGEDFFVKKVLHRLVLCSRNAILFDVGANVGDYSIALAGHFNEAKIYSFEPNPETFNQLKRNTVTIANIMPINFGLGNAEKSTEIFTYEDDSISQHASVFANVLTDLHKAKRVKNFSINITSIDRFCKKNEIDKIDFLKIDTEGFEFEILKGASQMIKSGSIHVIQFEFNEMNIISKVFLNDFYNLLPNYDFFRLDTERLIALRDYDPINEIFRFQNIIAIRKDIER
jgi:FkbM family methyltransferase